MEHIIIKCTYQTAENPRGSQNLLESDFMVELQLDDAGTVASWAVDDRTACFYTDLAKYDENEILFEGSEMAGQTGSLHIDCKSKRFTQMSDVNGEWLELTGNVEFVGSQTSRYGAPAITPRLRKHINGTQCARARGRAI